MMDCLRSETAGAVRRQEAALSRSPPSPLTARISTATVCSAAGSRTSRSRPWSRTERSTMARMRASIAASLAQSICTRSAMTHHRRPLLEPCKLLAGDAPLLARVLQHGPREPGIRQGGVATALVGPARHLHGGPLVFRAAPRVQRLTAEGAPSCVLVSGAAQRGEGGRVAAALGGAVPAVAELVRPRPQPQRRQLRAGAEPPRRLHQAPNVLG